MEDIYMQLNILMILSFLFFLGSLGGWCLEVVFRRFFSAANPGKKWINPGFLTGPYLPLYGFSLCALYLLSKIDVSFIKNIYVRNIVLFIIMAIVVTFIEYVAGEIFIKRMKIKLWDYEKEWGNIKGIICPKFSFFWAVLSVLYYFFLHPNILKSLEWLSAHLTFLFFMGFFYGIFVLDFWYTMNMMSRIKAFAEEYEIIVRYEMLKESIRLKNEELKEKRNFIFALKSESMTFTENLKNYFMKEQEKVVETKKTIQKKINNVK